MFFIFFTADVIGTITILVSYGIVSLVGFVHITFPKTRIMLFPPPTIFTMPVIHFISVLMIMLNVIAISIPNYFLNGTDWQKNVSRQVPSSFHISMQPLNVFESIQIVAVKS